MANAPENSALNRRGWKKYIPHLIPKPVGVFLALVMVTGLSFFPAALSDLRASNELINGTLAVAEDYVVLLGEIPKFDWQNTQVVSVQWSLYGIGQYKLQLSDASPDFCAPPNAAMDIYIDNSSQPVFSYDPADVLRLTNLGVEVLTSIPSVYSFWTERGTFVCKPQYYVSYDCYSFSASGFAIGKETNNSIPLFFGLSSSGMGDFGVVSFLLQSSTNFTRVVDGQLVTTEVDSSIFFSNITRSKRARALTYFLFTINWLLTLCSMVITAFSFRLSLGKAKYSIALLPITLILTIPTVRSFYPGTPPLGVFIDLVGFFPQMLSVAFCIAVTLAGFATRRDCKGAKSTTSQA